MVKRPDPLESTPPAFGDQAARQILRDGFGVESSSLTRLAGERDQNFRVDTAAGQRLLFKISNPADDAPILAMQAAALRHIEQTDPDLPVMRARPTAAGESWVEVPGPDGRTYAARLFTFLPGRAVANTTLTGRGDLVPWAGHGPSWTGASRLFPPRGRLRDLVGYHPPARAPAAARPCLRRPRAGSGGIGA